MDVEPKVVPAWESEDLSLFHRLSLARKRIAIATLLLLLVSGAALGVSKLEVILSYIGFNPAKEASVVVLEIFRKMSFIPNASRVEAPEFLLQTLDGQNRSLRQERGKLVLVNFWATWCPPCVREMPAMQRAYDKFKGQGFQIIAISVDQGNFDAVRKFVEDLNLNFTILLDPENTAKRAYGVRALPTTYLIDRGGRVVAYGMGAREWDGEAAFALIDHLLKKKRIVPLRSVYRPGGPTNGLKFKGVTTRKSKEREPFRWSSRLQWFQYNRQYLVWPKLIGAS